MLDDMHKCKTDMADEIFVINVNGYIWESARSEIEYATAHEKHVNHLEQILIYQLTMDLEEENV